MSDTPQNPHELARKQALRFLERRALSTKELRDKLTTKGIDPHVADETVSYLTDLRLLDDVDYAEQIVRHYHAKRFGRLRIEQELWRRGIAKDLWEDAFAETPDSTDDAIDALLHTKLRGQMPDPSDEKRAADALRRRGHNWDDISAGIRRYKESLSE